MSPLSQTPAVSKRADQPMVPLRLLVIIAVCVFVSLGLDPVRSAIYPRAYGDVPTGGAASPGWSGLLTALAFLRVGCIAAAFLLFVVACSRAVIARSSRRGWGVLGLVLVAVFVLAEAVYWLAFEFTV